MTQSKQLMTECWLLMALILWCRTANAQIDPMIRYQGQAIDNNGVPLEGPYTLTFRLYDAPTAGTKLWEETQTNVPLTAGNFSVLLGQITPLTSMAWDQARWLSVQLNTDPELSPRQQITAVPTALRAQTAEQLAQPTTLRSRVIEFFRTALAGSGAQAITGLGFQPTGVFVMCTHDGQNKASWGFGDSTRDERGIMTIYGNFSYLPTRLIAIDDGFNTMSGFLQSFDADGFTVNWTRANAGMNVACVAMGVR